MQWARTIKGRVVYERKRHLFNMRDSQRIQGAILSAIAGKPGEISRFVADATLYLLNEILGLVDAAGYKEVVYAWALYLLGVAMEKLGLDSGDFARRIFQRIRYDLPAEVGDAFDAVSV